MTVSIIVFFRSPACNAALGFGVGHASPCVFFFCEWSSVICVRDLRREAIVLPVSGYPISGLHYMLRVHVSAPIHWRFQKNQPTFSNLHVLNQIFCRPQRQWTASSWTRSSFWFFARDTDGGRVRCLVGAVGGRDSKPARRFFFFVCDATEQKRGAGTGQLEQNKAVALMGWDQKTKTADNTQ